MEREELRVLCQTLWELVKRTVGKKEVYYTDKYIIQVDWVDEVLRVYSNSEKIVGYNSEWGVLNWFATDEDYDNLWLVISNHDDMYGFDWKTR